MSTRIYLLQPSRIVERIVFQTVSTSIDESTAQNQRLVESLIDLPNRLSCNPGLQSEMIVSPWSKSLLVRSIILCNVRVAIDFVVRVKTCRDGDRAHSCTRVTIPDLSQRAK